MRLPKLPDALDRQALSWIDDARAMAAFLTRIPVGRAPSPSPRSLRAMPLAGALAGAVGAIVLVLAHAVGLAPTVSAIAAVAAGILVTGALHEDGLADVADGFGGGATAQARLDIMRDSRIGTYGALALILSVLARIALLASIIAAAGPFSAALALIATAALSRSAIVHLLASLAPARSDGLGHGVGTPDLATAWQAHGVALAIAVVAITPMLGVFALGGALAATAAAAVAMVMLARHEIGGQTGDVCGATQQGAEIAALTLIAIAA